MKAETKDLLKSIGTNAAGTVVGAAILGVFAFFLGKINLVVIYWKEITFTLLVFFILATIVVWFQRLLLIEKKLESIKVIRRFNEERDDAYKDPESVRKVRKDLIGIAKSILNGNNSNLKYKVVELEIEDFKSNGQIGEISKLIEKLHLDIERTSNHGIRDTLMEIREYIKKSGIPHYYIEDLNKALKIVEKDFSVLTSEITILSQEKLRKI